jgi:non-ribosomal peptide synthetase component E (peptide arylation enzyme)
MISMNLFTHKDIVVQMAACSYDVHVQEIIGTLMIGATIVMLPPDSNMDVEYVLMTVQQKQVSYMQTVPAYLNNMLDIFLKFGRSKLNALRTIDIGGECFVLQLQKCCCMFCRRY